MLIQVSIGGYHWDENNWTGLWTIYILIEHKIINQCFVYWF